MIGPWKAGTALAAWLLGLTAIGCGQGSEDAAASTAGVSARSEADDAAAFEAELLGLVNRHRVSMGLNALLESASLTAVARDHSVDMIAQTYFGHWSPEGLTAGGRLSAAGVTWTSVGENLAEGWWTPRAVLEAWLLSPLHRENLERADWTHAGVGVARGETGGVVTQLFLRP